MSLASLYFTYLSKYSSLYHRVVSMKPVEPWSHVYAPPDLLFRKSSGAHVILNDATGYSFWSKLFKHKVFGQSFLAYYTAYAVCIPRLFFMSFFFPSISYDNGKIDSITLTCLKCKKSIMIKNMWFSNFADNLKEIECCSAIKRVTAWKLLFASLALYNDAVWTLQNEADRLRLIPPLHGSWHDNKNLHIKDGKIFAELAVTEFRNGERLSFEERIPHFVREVPVPEGWQLEEVALGLLFE